MLISKFQNFIAAILIISLNAFADQSHDSHDWRTDKKAFASVELDTKIYSKFSKSQSIESTDAKSNVTLQISESDFKTRLEELTGARDITINGNITRIKERGSEVGRSLARQWLGQEYKALGFAVSHHTYSGGANFIAEKAGTSGKVFILSSHMDSVSNAGANDDAAGTVANLLIAKALMGMPHQHTLRIIAFDNEEQGLVGSRAYVKTLGADEIIGNIQMEMMTFNSRKDGKFHVIDCDRSESVFLTNSVMQMVQTLELPLARVKACTTRSDHGSFWSAKIPSIVISENFFGGDGDVCYHEKCDIVDDRLDFKYASLITKAIGNTVANLLK